MSTLQKVQHSFRRSLKTYNEHAFVQLEIAQTLAKMLSEHCLIDGKTQSTQKDFERAFEIGCGTGFLTKALLNELSVKHFCLNDLVAECEAELLEELKPFIGKQLAEWQFFEGDINQIEIAAQHDLICSASSLQWVDDLPRVLEKITQSLRSQGWLALSSFTPEHFVELRELNHAHGNSNKHLNYADVAQWQELLSEQFDVKEIQVNKITVWFDTFDELLKHLRNTGVNGNARQQWTQTSLREFEQSYQSRFAQNGRLPLSYEPIFIVAKKR